MQKIQIPGARPATLPRTHHKRGANSTRFPAEAAQDAEAAGDDVGESGADLDEASVDNERAALYAEAAGGDIAVANHDGGELEAGGDDIQSEVLTVHPIAIANPSIQLQELTGNC